MLRKRNVLEDAWSHVGSCLDVATFLARLRASGCTLLRDACCASNKLADILAEGWSLKRAKDGASSSCVAARGAHAASGVACSKRSRRSAAPF